MNWFREHQAAALVVLALVAFMAISAWEAKSAARSGADGGAVRWTANFGLYAGCQLMPYLSAPLVSLLLMPMLGVPSGSWPGSTPGSGLISSLLGIVLAVLVLDALGYIAHWCLHRVDLLWRVHQAHHSDLTFDASLGFRFHPLEVLFTTTLILALMAVTGMPPEGLLAYGLLNAVHNAFAHANAHLGPGAERLLRLVIITPDLHRTHHAADGALSSRNYGIVFSFWDRLFGTWHAARRDEPARVGLPHLRDPARLGLGALLLLPLQRCDGEAPRRPD